MAHPSSERKVPRDRYIDGDVTDSDRPETGRMSLRDYFAAQALTGLLASGKDAWVVNGALKGNVDEVAYFIADALLAHREKVTHGV